LARLQRKKETKMTPLQRIIVKESDGVYKIVIKEGTDLSQYQYVGMKQFGKDMLEEYHAK
jgi:hypothetical protein